MVLRRATKPGDECDVHEWRRYLLWHRGEVQAVKRRTNRRERREAGQDVRGHGLRAGDWDSDEDAEDAKSRASIGPAGTARARQPGGETT